MESKQQVRLIDTGNVRWQDRIHALGRLLASILRHRAIDLGLSMRSDGYVRVNDLLKLEERTYAGFPMCSHTVDEIKEAVRLDDKQRFKLVEENGQLLIRANQGHSIEIVDSEKLFRRIQSPDEIPICVHGSYKTHLESIRRNGLNRMHRVHIHFATGLPTDNRVINGVQDDAQILIHLDVQKTLNEIKEIVIERGLVPELLKYEKPRMVTLLLIHEQRRGVAKALQEKASIFAKAYKYNLDKGFMI